MARIALVGGGSMGEALLSGLLRAGRQGFTHTAATDERDSSHAAQHLRRLRVLSLGRGDHRQLAALHHDAARRVDDGVVFVEPVLTDLHARADHP